MEDDADQFSCVEISTSPELSKSLPEFPHAIMHNDN